MKKILALSLCIGAVSAMAEMKPYFGGSLGYAFGLPSNVIGSNSSYSYNTVNSTSASNGSRIFGSLGADALALSLHGGAMDNGVVGAELGLEYLKGFEQDLGKSTDSYITSTGTTTTTSTDTWTHSGFFLTPAVVIAAKGPFTPYAKFGLVLGLGQTGTMTSHDVSATKDTTTKFEYSGGMSFGISGALGGEYRPNQHLGLFAELNARSVTWSPGKYVNGTRSRTLEDTWNSSDTTKAGSVRIPFSAVQLKIGVNYHL